MPQSDPAWIEGFLDGFLDLAGQHGIALVGGDTTRGPLSIAVTAMGILLANMRGVPLTDILHFKESLTILFISGLFILLAARIEPAMFSAIGFGALLVLLAVQFVAQPDEGG